MEELFNLAVGSQFYVFLKILIKEERYFRVIKNKLPLCSDLGPDTEEKLYQLSYGNGRHL